MWLEAHPLFHLSITTSSPAQQSSSSSTTQQTAFQMQYKIDEQCVSNAEVFNMRTSVLRLLRHPNVLKLSTEAQQQNISSQQQQQSSSRSTLIMLPKIVSAQPNFVVPLCEEWSRLHSSEIVHGVYETTKMLAFILEKTGLRFTSFSSYQLYRDVPDSELKIIGERQQQQKKKAPNNNNNNNNNEKDNNKKNNDETSSQVSSSSTPTSTNISSSSSVVVPSLSFGSPATPVSPLRYRWILGDGKSFFDRSEFVRSPTKGSSSDVSGFSSSHEQDVMLMQSSVSAIARWLKDDVIDVLMKEETGNGGDSPTRSNNSNNGNSTKPWRKIDSEEEDGYFLSDLLLKWANKVEDSYANSGEQEEEKEAKEEEVKEKVDKTITAAAETPEEKSPQDDQPEASAPAAIAEEKESSSSPNNSEKKLSLQEKFDKLVQNDLIAVKDLGDSEKDRFKQRLSNFYTKHSPDNIKSVEIAVKMTVSESKVFEKVCAKYEVDPMEEFAAALEAKLISTATATTEPPPKESSSKKEVAAKKLNTDTLQQKQDWSVSALRDLIVLLHSWAITNRNDPLSVVLHIGQNMHVAEMENLEAHFDVLAESITLIPSNLAARRVWPWLIRPGYLAQKYAAKSFCRLVTFARLTASSNSNSSSAAVIRDVLGPLVASTTTLALVTSARDVFSTQRQNAIEVITACLKRKTVEGKSEDRKVGSLPSLTIPLLVRIVVPELLLSLIQILMSLNENNNSGNTNNNNSEKMLKEVLGSPLNSISQLCEMNLSDSKQLYQSSLQIQKSLSDRIANSFGGQEMRLSPASSSSSSTAKKQNSNTANNVILNKEKQWECITSHLDCLDSVLITLFELILHSSLQNNVGATAALRSKLFESLVVPVLGVTFMNAVSLAKKEDEVVQQKMKAEEKQEQVKPHQQQAQPPSKTLTAEKQSDSNNNNNEKQETPTKITETHQDSEEPVQEESKTEVKSNDEEEATSPVSIPDFAAERRKERKTRRNRETQRRRNQYSSDEDEEEEDYFEEEEEEQKYNSDDESSYPASSEEQEEKSPSSSDQDQEHHDDENEDNTENKNINIIPISTPPHQPALTFLSHLSRMLSKMLLVWHQPAAVQNLASRGLLWQIIIRSVNIVSSDANSEKKINISPKIVSAIFDPLVEAAMSIKEAIEFEIVSGNSSAADDNLNSSVNSSSTTNKDDETGSSSSRTNRQNNNGVFLSTTQKMAAVVYFEIVQYLIPSLIHLTFRGFSTPSTQLLMKMLNLHSFLENLRTSLKFDRERDANKNSRKKQNANDDEDEQNGNDDDSDDQDQQEEESNRNEEDVKAKREMRKFVLPWSVQLDETANAFLSSSSSDSEESSKSRAKLFSQLWASLPSLRQVASQKLTFFRTTGNLLSEITAMTLDNSNSGKNQTNWILNALTDCVLVSSSSPAAAQVVQRQHEAYPAVAALLNGGSFVSCPPGMPSGIDSDTMMRSWYRSFVSTGTGVGTHSEKACLIHLLSRFGNKEFDPFPLMPPIN